MSLGFEVQPVDPRRALVVPPAPTMADTHGAHDPHAHASKAHEGKGPHAHPEPEEDPLRTPGWMPLVGLGLLMVGALWMYLYVSPGVWSASTAAIGDGGAAADAAAP